MAQEIIVGNEILEFPDNMSDNQIKIAMKSYKPVTQSNLSPLNRLYDVGEQAVMQGLEYIAPVLSTIGNISKAGSEAATKIFESTPLGVGTRFAQQAIGSVIPENIKQGRLSDIAPSLYSESGRGIQLQRAGMLDPTAQEAYTGAEQMALDPLNLVPFGGGFGKAASAVKQAVGKAATETGEVLGTAITGVPKHVIKNYKKFAPDIEKIRLSGTGVESVASDLNQKVAYTIKDKLQQIGQELGDEISKAGGAVDVSKVKSSFDNAINNLKISMVDNPSPVNESKIMQLEKVRNKFFPPEQVTEEIIGYETKLVPDYEFGGTKIAENVPIIKQVVKGNTISPKSAFELQQDLKDIMAFAPKTLEGKYSGLSQAERVISKSADDAYNNINKQLDSLTSGASSALKNKYKKYIEIRDRLEPIAGGDAQKTFNALKTMKRPDRKLLKAEIKKIDKELGTNITDSVDLLETYAYLGDPSWNPLSGGGVTSTTRTLGNLALGSVLGGGINPITATMMAGAGSPAMLKQALNLGIGARQIAANLPKIKLPNLTPAQQLALYQGMAAAGQQQ